VEDDQYFNQLLEMYVREICNSSSYPSFDFEVRTYLNAHDFIVHMDKSVDILLLDYYLYNAASDVQLNGFQVLSMLKRRQPYCKVILLSSLSDPEKLDGLRQKGIHAHVDKNFHTTSRVGMILQETVHSYAASA
jgi:DNA-binding NarL/FixJ family response regulator